MKLGAELGGGGGVALMALGGQDGGIQRDNPSRFYFPPGPIGLRYGKNLTKRVQNMKELCPSEDSDYYSESCCITQETSL